MFKNSSLFIVILSAFVFSSCGQEGQQTGSKDSSITTQIISESLPGTWKYEGGYSPSFGSLPLSGFVTYENDQSRWSDFSFATASGPNRWIMMENYRDNHNGTIIVQSPEDSDEQLTYSIKGDKMTVISSIDDSTMTFTKWPSKLEKPSFTQYNIDNSSWILVSKEMSGTKFSPPAEGYGKLEFEQNYKDSKSRNVKRVNLRYDPNKNDTSSELHCDSDNDFSQLPEPFKLENITENTTTHEITGTLTLRILNDRDHTICQMSLSDLQLLNLTHEIKNTDVVFDLRISSYEMILTNRSTGDKYTFKVSEF